MKVWLVKFINDKNEVQTQRVGASSPHSITQNAYKRPNIITILDITEIENA